MRCSLNELYRTCQKAAEGVGVPAGVDIDVAESTVWLVVRELPVLDRFIVELQQISGGDFSSAWMLEEQLDATGRSGAMWARAVVDLLIAGSDGVDNAQLAVKGLSNPLYLLPAARRYTQAGWCFWFDLSGPTGERFRFDVSAHETKLMAPPGLTLAALTGDAEFELTAGWA